MATIANTMAPAISSIRGLFDWDMAMNAIIPTEPIIGTTVVMRFEALTGSSRSGGGSRASSPSGRVGVLSSPTASAFFFLTLAMSPPLGVPYRLIVSAKAITWQCPFVRKRAPGGSRTGSAGTRRRTHDRIHVALNPNRMS